MDINQCPNCQNQYDQDRRVSKQLSCGCFSCLQCYRIVFKEINCVNHQQVYNIRPEELQDYVVQEQVQQEILRHQEQFIDQELINDQFKYMQDQYEQKKNQNREILKEIQDSSQFFQHIQSLAIKEILKSLIAQSSMSNERIKNLLKRVTELKVIIVAQQQQDLRVDQQNPHVRQNPQYQQQHKFQQILREIEELKKDQWMDVQSLRVNIQRCMFNLFIYLSENSSGYLLSDNEAELLVQEYFKQFKVIRDCIQLSNFEVQKKNSFLSQSIDQQIIQESQNNNYQFQNQIIDKQQGQELVQDKQFSVQKVISQQEKQVIEARVIFQQLEQKLLNLSNDFSFNNQVNQLCQEQEMIIEQISLDILTFDKLVQFLNQIKNEIVSIQALQFSPLNKQGLIEQVKILQQLTQVTDQQISSKLFQILKLSKNQPQIQQVATNVITLLNYMNFDFTNQDLSNLDLTRSDLSDTTFTNCLFNNSNLTSANLRNTKFINCDLSNANITSIITEQPHIFTGHSSKVNSIAISSDSEFIVSGSRDNTVRLWDVKTGTSKIMSSHTNSFYAVAISSNSEFIVSGSRDNTVRLWDVKTGTCKTMSGHTNSVLSVAISSDSEFIVSGSSDKTVRLWYVKTGTCKTMSGHTNYVTAVATSSDSEFIVSGSGDDTIRLWSTKTQQCVKVLLGHSKSVYSVIFSSDNKYIISGSKDKTIRVWIVQSGQPICELNNFDYVGSLSLSHDGNWLVSSTGH